MTVWIDVCRSMLYLYLIYSTPSSIHITSFIYHIISYNIIYHVSYIIKPTFYMESINLEEK